MKNFCWFIGIALMCLAGTPMAAEKDKEWDAEIAEMEGSVLFNGGQDYREAKLGMKLKNGDRLMVMEDSKVTIEYEDGCDEVWEGPVVREVNGEDCGGGLALWLPCVIAGGGLAGDEDIILSKVKGTVQVSKGFGYETGEEGQELEYGDKVKIQQGSEATVEYEEVCSITRQGYKIVDITRDACPIATLEEIEGDVLVKQRANAQFVPAADGMRIWHDNEIKVMEEASVEIVYDAGCDETWEGYKLDNANAEDCAAIAAAVPTTCLTPLGAVAVATGVIGGVAIIRDPDDGGGGGFEPEEPPDPPPPVSP